MTPKEALEAIKAILQPSVVTQLASSGTIETWKRIESLLEIVEKQINQSLDSEP